MKNRYWMIAVFVLVLPAALYFYFKHSPEHALKKISIPSEKQSTQIKEHANNQNPAVKRVIEHWVSKTGAQVFFVAANEIPMLDIQINFDAGSARDNDKPGIAMLMTRLLDKGIEDLNANQIAEKFEDAGAQYKASIDRDKATISLRTLTKQVQLNSTIDLFAELLANSTFTDETIDLEKKLMSIELKQKDQLPNT